MIRRIACLLILALCLTSLTAWADDPAPKFGNAWIPGHYNSLHWVPGHWA